MPESYLIFPYWDIKPRHIAQPYDTLAKSVPVDIVGSPSGDVVFSTTDQAIAAVTDGTLTYGATAGAAVIVAEAVSGGVVVSRRYLQVEVGIEQEQAPAKPPIRSIEPSGYVEELPDGVWHFKYFTDWFDQMGGNVRVQGELTITLDLDKHYWLCFDVWGEIESMAAQYHDRLDLYLNDKCKLNLNLSSVTDPAWDKPCIIPRRTERVDLWEFIGRSVTARFVWDTRDERYQAFDGWYVANIRLASPEDVINGR